MPETKRHTNVTPEVSGSAKHEIYYGTNPATSEPIMIDRTSLSNTCEILCGPDVSKMIENEIKQIRTLYHQDEIILLDPFSCYGKLCRHLGGQVISVYQDPDLRLNPFDVPENLDVHQDADYETWVNEKALLMVAFMEIIMDNPLTDQEKEFIYQVTGETCSLSMACTESWHDNEGFYHERHETPTVYDFRNVLREWETLDMMHIRSKLEQRVRNFFEPLRQSNVFMGRTNVTIEKKLISYDFACDPPTAMGTIWLGMLVCLNQVQNRVANNAVHGVRTWVFIDDASLLCNRSMSAGLLLSFCKSARTRNCFVTFGIRDIQQFYADSGWYLSPKLPKHRVEIDLWKNSALVRISGYSVARRLAKFANLPEECVLYLRNYTNGGIVQYGTCVEPFVPEENTDCVSDDCGKE